LRTFANTIVDALIALLVVTSLLAASPGVADGPEDDEGTRSPAPFGGVDDLLYGTFFGGGSIEPSCLVDVDADGNIYLAGTTMSQDFPTTTGAYDETPNGHTDIFAMKLSPDGSTLLFSTLIGGSVTDVCQGLDVDDDGNMFITGYTISDDFPTTTGAFSTSRPGGSTDLFLLRLDPSGGSLGYSTYLGGDVYEKVFGIHVDGMGNAYLTGETESLQFPTTVGAYDTTRDGQQDCFVTKMDPTGSELVYSTYIGGDGRDRGIAIESDASGRAYVAGLTDSSHRFPLTENAYDLKRSGASDGFVLRLGSDGSAIEMSTLLGGSEDDVVHDLTVDDAGAVLVIGNTDSPDFPTTAGAYYPDLDEFYGGSGPFGFATKVAFNGSALEYSTYIQNIYAQGEVRPTRVAEDGAGNAYIAGYTAYGTLPTTPEAIARAPSNGDEVFLMGLHATGSRITYSTYLNGEGDDECHGLVMAPDGTVVLSGTTYSTDFPTTSDAICQTLSGSSDIFAVRLDPTDTDAMVPVGIKNLETEATSSRIQVSWDPLPRDHENPVIGYRSYKGPPGGGEYYKFFHAGSEEFMDWDVEIGVTYEYTIVAVNYVGPGPPANVSDIPWTWPGAPKNLTATAGSSSVTLEWSPPESSGGLPILGYLIYRGTSVYNLDNIGGVTNNTTYVDTNVTGGRVYYYYVSAFHEMANGRVSSIVAVVPYGVPGPPANLILTAGDSYIIVVWDKPFEDGGNPVTSYTLYRGLSEDSLAPLATLRADGRLEFLDMDLVNGVDYHYMVTASNSAGEGPGSAVVRSMPRGVPGPPMGVHTIPGNGKVLLVWEAPSWQGGTNVHSYRIYRGLEPDKLKIVNIVGVKINEYSDSNVGNGYRFYYAVQAMNSIGGGEMSNMVSAIPFGPPTWPMTIEVEPGLNRLILKWTPPKDDGGYPVREYEIYRGRARQLVESLVSVNGSVTEYVDTDVKVGVVYYYRLIVQTGVASSSPSWVVAGSPFGPPSVPKGITILPFPDRVLVSWGTPPGHRQGGYEPRFEGPSQRHDLYLQGHGLQRRGRGRRHHGEPHDGGTARASHRRSYGRRLRRCVPGVVAPHHRWWKPDNVLRGPPQGRCRGHLPPGPRQGRDLLRRRVR
jgi:fibronectin type 3 domain-containing protein